MGSFPLLRGVMNVPARQRSGEKETGLSEKDTGLVPTPSAQFQMFRRMGGKDHAVIDCCVLAMLEEKACSTGNNSV